MKKYFFLLLCLFSISSFNAQSDSTKLVYDVIYMKDGRVFKGEILSFNENNGTIIFKNKDGSKYTFKAEEYDRYRENVAYDAKKPFEIRPRKESGIEFHVGFNLGMISFNSDFTEDENFDRGPEGGYSYVNSSIRVGVGKYFNRQNYAGITADIGLTGLKNYFSAGFRYTYQYDGYKKNVAFYIPIELKYTSLQESSTFDHIDSTAQWVGGEKYNITSQREIKTNYSLMDLKIGQGFSFIMANKKSLNLELFFVKSFVLSSKMIDAQPEPKISTSINSFGLSLMYNI